MSHLFLFRKISSIFIVKMNTLLHAKKNYLELSANDLAITNAFFEKDLGGSFETFYKKSVVLTC